MSCQSNKSSTNGKPLWKPLLVRLKMVFSKPLEVNKKRFAEISDDDLIVKHQKVQKKNTLKGEMSAQRQY